MCPWGSSIVCWGGAIALSSSLSHMLQGEGWDKLLVHLPVRAASIPSVPTLCVRIGSGGPSSLARRLLGRTCVGTCLHTYERGLHGQHLGPRDVAMSRTGYAGGFLPSLQDSEALALSHVSHLIPGWRAVISLPQ